MEENKKKHICPNCSTEVKPNDTSCFNCEIEFWECENCNTLVSLDSNKCSFCNAEFNSSNILETTPISEQKTYKIQFTGSSKEYFKIWIVNMFLC